jgi:magnesium transporter
MQLPKSTQREVEHLSQYPSNCAGGMMEVRIQLFHPQDSVEEATNKLRKQRVRNVSSVYLVNIDGTLAGRVFLQDLVTAGPDEKLSDISQSTPWVAELAPKEEVIEIVEQSRVPSIPVLNADRVVIGVIRHEKLMSIAHQGALDDLQKMVGVGKDEKALSHPLFSVKKRLPWLTINLGTTFLAAFVVGMFEETIAKITALAVLLPVVAGQSGNTGAQAQAVTMRSLALREIRLKHKWRVLIK